MLFTGEDGTKRLSALSGGEVSRLVFARLGIERPNVLVLDEPTNHLDLESIEALVEGLQQYQGTLIFVSHDRWFVSQLATRIVEIRADGITDYPGTYDEYVHACGDDHLDVDRVVLKAKKEKLDAKGAAGTKSTGTRRPNRSSVQPRLKKLRARLDEVTGRIEAAESRVGEIDTLFCGPDYFTRTSGDEIRARQDERVRLEGEVVDLMIEWERLEAEVAELEQEAGG
jgi:energy-coupling factor transporter ATP-binding protein EcfA2